MKENAAPPHLRLIATTQQQGHDKRPAHPHREDSQLSFAYPDASSVFLLYLDAIGKNEFAQILGQYLPKWIVDVRAVPRLDTIATSRLSAFALFESKNAAYIDLFGRLQIKSCSVAGSNPAFWSSAVLELLENSQRRGPYLFLFDDEKLLQMAGQILPEVIRPKIGKEARFAQIHHSGEGQGLK